MMLFSWRGVCLVELDPRRGIHSIPTAYPLPKSEHTHTSARKEMFESRLISANIFQYNNILNIVQGVVNEQ